jgi:hypothetical protein
VRKTHHSGIPSLLNIDVSNLNLGWVITAGNVLLKDTRAYFGGLITTNGLNWVYFVTGEVFFLANLISLLAYMWIPPFIQHEESESRR